MKRRSLIGLPALVAALFSSSGAFAQAGGFAVDRFDPAERGSDWFVSESLDLRGSARPAFGVVLDWGHKPLVVYDTAGHERSRIVGDQVFLHAGGSYVVADRLRFGLNLPLAIYQSGDAGAVGTTTFRGADKPALGDLRLGVDARLFGRYNEPVTGAVGVQVFLPTGNRDLFTGDGTVRFQPRALLAGDVGGFVYAAKIALDYRPYSEVFAGSQLGTELVFSAAAGLKVRDTIVLGPELYGSTVLNDAAFKTRNTPVEGLFGGHFTFAENWKAGAGIGPGFSRGYGTPALRVVASLEFAAGYCEDADQDEVCASEDACPSAAGPTTADPKTNGCPADRDRDGILDKDDACPDERGVKTTDPRTNGCPDRDGDGVVDKEDACVDVAGVRTDNPQTNGCPPDRDKDGIVDSIDACPDVPGPKTDDPRTNGCPDRDKDGVADHEDACVDVPGVRTSDPKTNGCPSDRDKDGILDKDDACPDQPGESNPDPKKNGCPKAFVEGKQIKITDQIKFRFGKAELDPASDSTLQAVAKILSEHPEVKIRIEGHTDNKGPATINTPLSKARAAAVRKWLEQHSIETTRLTSDGFGPMHPLDANDTEEGRRNNRRVEFHILDEAPKP